MITIASLQISRNINSISVNGLTKKPAEGDEQVFAQIFQTGIKLSNTSSGDHFLISVEQNFCQVYILK